METSRKYEWTPSWHGGTRERKRERLHGSRYTSYCNSLTCTHKQQHCQNCATPWCEATRWIWMSGNSILLYFPCCCSRKGTGGSFKAVGYKGTEHHTHTQTPRSAYTSMWKEKFSSVQPVKYSYLCMCMHMFCCLEWVSTFCTVMHICVLGQKADYADTWKLKTLV